MDKNFINSLKDNNLFTISHGNFYWDKGAFTAIKGWPQGLDSENLEVTGIGENYIYGMSAGDWQAMTCFKLVFDGKSLYIDPFLEPMRKQTAASIKKVEREILDMYRAMEPIKESKDHDVKELKKSFDEFNKEFFDGQLPEVEIRITDKDTEHSKGVAGSFNFHQSIHSNADTSKHFKLSDLKKNKNREGVDQNAYDYIVGSSYIEMPKDIVKRGKYYYASVLIHEMVHEYIELLSDSHETDPHGPDFRKKVDEINKKSKNEWRVGYEEVPQILNSKDELKNRPEGDE